MHSQRLLFYFLSVGICTSLSKFEYIFMTVLDQVLEAEQVSEAAITAAKETAARTIASAETAKQSAIAEAKTAALATVESATTVTAKADELTKSVVAAFNAG
jgi:vacuolar-type H+-ATPase subunit H